MTARATTIACPAGSFTNQLLGRMFRPSLKGFTDPTLSLTPVFPLTGLTTRPRMLDVNLIKEIIMRFVYSAPNATVFYNFEYEEFVVKFYRDGVALPDADYFTNDRTEAIETALSFTEEV
jgi:hypothetical protein